MCVKQRWQQVKKRKPARKNKMPINKITFERGFINSKPSLELNDTFNFLRNKKNLAYKIPEIAKAIKKSQETVRKKINILVQKKLVIKKAIKIKGNQRRVYYMAKERDQIKKTSNKK